MGQAGRCGAFGCGAGRLRHPITPHLISLSIRNSTDSGVQNHSTAQFIVNSLRHRKTNDSSTPSIDQLFTMAKSKSAKRKQNAQSDSNSRKLAKTAPGGVITPPPDGSKGDDALTSLDPTSLQSVISIEELEITVDTLKTLAQYPGLIKTKPCKDLRTAAYDFRQACTTGSISAGMSIRPPSCSIYSMAGLSTLTYG